MYNPLHSAVRGRTRAQVKYPHKRIKAFPFARHCSRFTLILSQEQESVPSVYFGGLKHRSVLAWSRQKKGPIKNDDSGSKEKERERHRIGNTLDLEKIQVSWLISEDWARFLFSNIRLKTLWKIQNIADNREREYIGSRPSRFIWSQCVYFIAKANNAIIEHANRPTFFFLAKSYFFCFYSVALAVNKFR